MELETKRKIQAKRQRPFTKDHCRIITHQENLSDISKNKNDDDSSSYRDPSDSFTNNNERSSKNKDNNNNGNSSLDPSIDRKK